MAELSKRRFVNIYNDPEIPGTRFISDEDWEQDEIDRPHIDKELVIETVELLHAEEDGKTVLDRLREENADLKEAVGHLWSCVDCGEGPPCETGKAIQAKWLTENAKGGMSDATLSMRHLSRIG